jgi:surface polysaccharide O-acyltransferase-like enzyme
MKLSLLYFYAALLGMLVLLISSLVQFELWVNLSGILVFQPSRLPIYGGFFILGLVAANVGWQLQESSLPRLRILLPFALFFCIALIASRAGIPQLPRGLVFALGSFFYPLVAMSLFLVALHGALATVRLKLRIGVSRASFGIYLLHLPLVVVLQYILVGLSYSPWLKAALVAGVAGVVSYLLTHLIIRLPVVRTII